jgi:hypothetical protein
MSAAGPGEELRVRRNLHDQTRDTHGSAASSQGRASRAFPTNNNLAVNGGTSLEDHATGARRKSYPTCMTEILLSSAILLIAGLALLATNVLVRHARRRRAKKRRLVVYLRSLLAVRNAAVQLTFSLGPHSEWTEGGAATVTVRTREYLALVRALSIVVSSENKSTYRNKKAPRLVADLPVRVIR